VNLAAQAGVRYSIDNPLAYVDSNLVGTTLVLEGCRYGGVEHLVVRLEQPFEAAVELGIDPLENCGKRLSWSHLTVPSLAETRAARHASARRITDATL